MDLILRICNKLIDSTEELDRLDSICGDGETGSNLARGAKSVKEEIEKCNGEISLQKIGLRLNAAGCGTLGTLWSFLLLKISKASSVEEAIPLIEEAFKKYSDAKVGDKTMADTLFHWIEYLKRPSAEMDWHQASTIAFEAALATKDLPGKKGRGQYAGKKSIGAVDPGAWATAIVLGEVSAYFASAKTGESK